MGSALIVIVLAVIVVFAVRSSRKHMRGEGGCCGGADEISLERKQLQGTKIGEKIIHIQGMKCDNCRKTVERMLNQIEGAAAQVNWRKGIAVLSMERDVKDREIKQALAWTEYHVTKIASGKGEARWNNIQ